MLQNAVLRAAPRAGDTASAVYVVAFQIGIAAGSAGGAATLGALGAAGLALVSALAAASALVLVVRPGLVRSAAHRT